MTNPTDRDPPSKPPVGAPAPPAETDAQRERREVDEEWEQSEQERHDEEIQRRVQEQWRLPNR